MSNAALVLAVIVAAVLIGARRSDRGRAAELPIAMGLAAVVVALQAALEFAR
ncbi:MAG TPA: hypothetical protein VGR46_16045 [Candidatus Limnocylindria bacterium]|jgi:hypothetical protein|nr:hypothetical protein [Candidatus Limnocylindria bacterium]